MTTRQYYYRVDGCEAFNSRKPSCICWHDEGTGPRAGAQGLTWRTKPTPTMADALAAQQAVMRQALEAIDARFRSGNRIPVEKAVVPSSEWHALRAALSATQEKPHG